MAELKTVQNDFGTDSIPRLITRMSIPLMLGQLVNILYNMVDRIYISNIPQIGSLALAGVGIAMPAISLIAAFAALLGQGGVPLFSIARGRGDAEEAGKYMGHAFVLIMGMSLLLMLLGRVFLEPVLWLFGATPDILGYAKSYLGVYLIGTPFAMLSLGLNGYISAQGFPRHGMATVLLGAVVNIILDPIFIYGLNMGVAGAAWATVLAQFLSAFWCLSFLRGKRVELRLQRSGMYLEWTIVRAMLGLGVSGFFMHLTNALMQTVINRQLGVWGGEVHLSAFVIINSLRLFFLEVILGFSQGMQPVLGYNYGAGSKRRVLSCIHFSAMVTLLLAIFVWGTLMLFPEPVIRIFTADAVLMEVTARSLKIFFCTFFIIFMQALGQSTFLGLGQAKKALFFTLLRKAFLVVPLVLLLPGLGLGVDGVYWSEPISEVLGGGSAFITMIVTVYLPIRRQLREEEKA